MLHRETRTFAWLLLGVVLAPGCGQPVDPKADLPEAPKYAPAQSQPAPLSAVPRPSAAASAAPAESTGELTVVADALYSQLLHERDDYTVAPPDIVQVSVKLPSRDEEARLRGVNGEHLVSPDGAIDLGARFGIIPAAGLTPQQIKREVQRRLAAELQHYDVTISVAEQNSKFYYIIVEGDSNGDTVMRIALVTGDENISHAMQHVKGADMLGKRIWIARPSAGGDDEILDVGSGDRSSGWTLHHLQADDRVFVASAARHAASRPPAQPVPATD
jgi:hypothetical protein